MLHLVFVTAPKREAAGLARQLLRERLIACANLLPGAESLYWWKGKIDRTRETLIIMKCPARNVKRVLRRVKELHPYDIPEILALRVNAVHPPYARWVERESRTKKANGKKVNCKQTAN